MKHEIIPDIPLHPNFSLLICAEKVEERRSIHIPLDSIAVPVFAVWLQYQNEYETRSLIHISPPCAPGLTSQSGHALAIGVSVQICSFIMRHCIKSTYNVKLVCTRNCYRNLVYAPFGKFQIFCNLSDILTCPPDIHISYSNILTWPAAHLISSSDILTCPLSTAQPLALDHSHLLPDNQRVSRFRTIAAKWVSRYPTNYPVFQYDCCTFISKSTVEYPI